MGDIGVGVGLDGLKVDGGVMGNREEIDIGMEGVGMGSPFDEVTLWILETDGGKIERVVVDVSPLRSTEA